MNEMKKNISIFLVCLVALCFTASAQPKQLKGPLPKGVVYTDGKVHAKKGYTLKLSEDKKTITVVEGKNNIVVGALKCECRVGNCEWIKILQPAESTYGCSGSVCCTIGVANALGAEPVKSENK